MNTTANLTCPKCHGAMASYERSGIVVDQCRDCRGLFLDRGELERLLDLESGTVAPAQPNPQWSAPAPDRTWRQEQPAAREWRGGRHDSDDDSHSGHGHRAGGHKRTKRSMLSEFLDFG